MLKLMQQDNIFSRSKVRWALIIGLVLIIAIALFIWWWLQRPLAPVVLQPQPVVPTNSNTSTTPPENLVVAPTGAEFSVVGRNFVERFGSFSNQSNKQNIKDVWSMITPAMQSRLSQVSIPSNGQGYVGIDTRVVGLKVSSQSETGAELRIKAQRSERKEDLTIKTYYQDIVVSLIKSGDQWLVDRAEWQ